jgi:hypothetical protein
MTRRTQKSSRQRKRQYTRRRGGGPKRGQWIWTAYCIIRNGIEQCFRKRTWKANNTNQKEETKEERIKREEHDSYYD